MEAAGRKHSAPSLPLIPFDSSRNTEPSVCVCGGGRTRAAAAGSSRLRGYPAFPGLCDLGCQGASLSLRENKVPRESFREPSLHNPAHLESLGWAAEWLDVSSLGRGRQCDRRDTGTGAGPDRWLCSFQNNGRKGGGGEAQKLGWGPWREGGGSWFLAVAPGTSAVA